MNMLKYWLILTFHNREGRAIWTGTGKSSQCRGTVTQLAKDEATVLKSHYSYGLQPYPENYHCRSES